MAEFNKSADSIVTGVPCSMNINRLFEGNSSAMMLEIVNCLDGWLVSQLIS
jgi:hypothetical protein